MPSGRRTLLYVYNTRSHFVSVDEDILRQHFEVRTLYVNRRSPALLLQMWRQTRDVDLVVAWFASWHSLPAFTAAWLRRIPRLLITGGYDVASEPDIQYGLRRGGLPRLLSSLCFHLSSRAYAFSHYSYDEALRNTPLRPPKLGMIPLGIADPPEFATPYPKEKLALTIGGIDHITVERKGIRAFVEAARLLPDVDFYVVGKDHDGAGATLAKTASSNVHFTGFMNADELTQLRRRAKVYVQASIHEGFGMAAAESMLARCVPVVTRRSALPEVVGDAGVYAASPAPEDVARAIESALNRDPSAGEYARRRILETYPLEARATALTQAIDSLLDSQKETQA